MAGIVRTLSELWALLPNGRGTVLIMDGWHGGHGHEAGAQFLKKRQ
jgi:hypothetical protein